MAEKNPLELAELYVKKLEKANSDEEISALIENVIDVLGPIASNDEKFQVLSESGRKIIKSGSDCDVEYPNPAPYPNSRLLQTFKGKKQKKIEGFVEIFNLFKINFKYESSSTPTTDSASENSRIQNEETNQQVENEIADLSNV